MYRPPRLLTKNDMVLFLETCTAEVSYPAAPSLRDKPRVLETARKDTAVHVSLSSDSLVKQPGNPEVSILFSTPWRRTKRPTKFEPPTTFRRSCPHISEELQRRVFTPLADGAPYDRAYMCDPSCMSTTKRKLSRRSNSARIQRLSHSLRVPAPSLLAALEPHSSAVLASVKDQGRPRGP